MRTYVAIGLAVLGLVLGRISTVEAQDSVLAELYGYGVHAYFAGEYEDSHEYLTTAIEQGTVDPRVYYFRGLAYTKLGRPDEAKTDYAKGADLETSGATRVFPIGHSMQRVQGRSRLEIERYRQKARLASRTRTMKANQARYEQLQNAEGQVLRDPNRPQPAVAKELVGNPPAADDSDPFGSGAADEAPGPAVATPAEPAAGGEDVFGGTAPSTPMPMPATTGEEDPFGTPSTPAAEDDPFGTPAAPSDAETDPFSDDPAAGDPAAGDPAADEMPAEVTDDDPFS